MSTQASDQPAPSEPLDQGDRAGESADSGLTRLELRLHPTQVALLDGMGRRLTRERRKAGSSGKRLNKSALMRAAVAVLIEARGQIHGTSEAEIADSLKRWLASGGGLADPLPRQTRDAIRDARRQLAAVDRLLDKAEAGPAFGPVTAVDQGRSGVDSGVGADASGTVGAVGAGVPISDAATVSGSSFQ